MLAAYGVPPPQAGHGGALRKSVVLPASSWDVSVTLDQFGVTGLWHYEDASRKPGPGADGVIRVIPRTVLPPMTMTGMLAVVTSWTAVVRVPEPVQGASLLEETVPLVAALLAAGPGATPGNRYFRVEDGAPVEVPAPPWLHESGRKLRETATAHPGTESGGWDHGRVRYDWNRYGNPGLARRLSTASWCVGAVLAALWLVSPWLVRSEPAFAVVLPLWTLAAVLHRVQLRKAYGVRETARADRARDVRELLEAAQAERAARDRVTRLLDPSPAVWDVYTVFPRDGWNGLVHYEDAAGKPGPPPDGVIRVRAEGAAWRASVRTTEAPGEAAGMLQAAAPLLRECLRREFVPGRYHFRLADGSHEGAVDFGPRPGSGPLAASPVPQAAARPVLPSMTAAEFGARLAAAFGPCAHPDAEPVDLITGERVAWVCPDCPAGLPANWKP